MQASAYEVYERIRTFLHTQNRDVQKKAHFAKSFKVCGRLHTQNNVFYLSLSIKQRSYEKISCICYFIGSVVKIVLYLHFRDPKDDRL